MKSINIVLGFVLILIAPVVIAQERAFFYTQYDSVYQSKDYEFGQLPWNSFSLDFDRDGITETYFTFSFGGHLNSPVSLGMGALDTTGQFPVTDEHWCFHWSEPKEDLLNISETQWKKGLRWDVWDEPVNHDYVAVRKTVEGGFCFGWLNVNYWWDSIVHPVYHTLDKIPLNIRIIDFAFCTIPNYSLKFGQTSITELVENETLQISIQPNPTADIVFIIGENLSLIEVIDILGQEIASLKANGDETTVDLRGQPAGVYLVSVTDTEGRRCVKKVVRQ